MPSILDENIPGILSHTDDDIGIAGWLAPENRHVLDNLISKNNIKSVTEIGSFLGLSAVWFAKRVDSVTCIDQWIELATFETENNLLGTLRRWELPRDFFSLYRENVMRSGLWHKIHPIRGHSHYVFGEVPVSDLVYIDGDHSYEGCKKDIQLYLDKARIVICGDDYIEREGFGVIAAVKRLLPKHHSLGPFWWYVK